MSAKTILAAALVSTVLGLGAARGQGTAGSAAPEPETATAPGGLIEGHQPGMLANVPVGTAPSDRNPMALPPYVTYQRPDCCGPVGGDGPIQTELYIRAGASLAFGGSALARSLDPGWEVAAGGRSLFFNPAMDAAWAVDIGLGNIFNKADDRRDIQIPMSLLLATPNPITGTNTATRVNFGTGGTPGVTLKSLNRTYFNFAVGREWYLMGTACAPGPRWRAGADLGIHYGSERADFNEVRHRPGVFEAPYVAVHTDCEYPCCSVVFLAGLRLEYSYQWSHILQSSENSEMSDLNLLVTAGVRY